MWSFAGTVLSLSIAAVASAAKPERVTVQGSSTVFPISDAIAQELEIGSGRTIEVVIAVSGTGGGIESLCKGEADIAGASRPISPEEAGRCQRAGVRFIELPIAYDALTVVVNPANDFVEAMSVSQLRALWAPESGGKMTHWNELDPSWPDRAIKLYGPDRASGTFDYFTAAIVGKAKSSRSDYSASDSDYALVQRISRDTDALGYFGYSYFAGAGDRLRAVPIRYDDDAPPVAPLIETVQQGSYRPLARPLFVYVNVKAYSRRPVRRYVDLLIDRVPAVAEELGFIPLTEALYRAIDRRLDQRTTGSAFAGHEYLDVSLERLLEIETRE
jgi:phosphate transport system substrate-binding protein